MKTEEKKSIKHLLSSLETMLPENVVAKRLTNTRMYYRNNPDGSLRWIWPADLNQPLFLNLYNLVSPRSKWIALLIKMLFALRLQRLFASGSVKIRNRITSSEWSLFAGTAGVNQTAVFFHNNWFYKVAVGEQAPQALEHEAAQLEALKKNQFHSMQVPDSAFNGIVLKQSNVSGTRIQETQLTSLHWKALESMADTDAEQIAVVDLPCWKNANDSITHLLEQQDQRIPLRMVLKLEALQKTIPEDAVVPAGLSHGDFTPWNIFKGTSTIAVIDWELSASETPLLFDAFHFIYQQASLVDQCSFDELAKRMEDTFQQPSAKAFVERYQVDVSLQHRLYLLHTISYYLNAYSKQSPWHPQVYMSINTWNHALNQLLVRSGMCSPRQLLISDLFDFLKGKEYALLKWTNNNPVLISEDADIDICLNMTTAARLNLFLEQHPLVKQIKVLRKSFMKNWAIVLKDDSFLSVDGIWEFKRRGTVMLKAEQLLQSAKQNHWGVRIPSIENDFLYTASFYLLNGANMPDKYQQNYNQLKESAKERLQLFIASYSGLQTKHYSEWYQYSKQINGLLVSKLNEQPANMGFNKWKNRFWYVVDGIRENLSRRGFIITFSGVDGAGKSTVIANIHQQIEKKYRRKVVVLRHRPSVLPMLSAWKEGGRAAAEQKAANTLPRQGKNRNLVSSLVRFSYYYLDYLLGQFVIYFKYVVRGYIVLYDRYYFDFINDGKRSNILLPKSFTSFCYRLLLKPRFNFFLYADAQVILNRKKELDASTIGHLTGDYLSLFRKLGRKKRRTKYVAIENNQLSDTLQVIHHTIKETALS